MADKTTAVRNPGIGLGADKFTATRNPNPVVNFNQAPQGGVPQPTAQQQQAQMNAEATVKQILDSYGLSDLMPQVEQWIIAGYDPTAIIALAQGTQQWQQRFAGNQQRIAQGLSPLSPSEYLATEAAYKQALSAAGLPTGFYDTREDFAKWIGEGKSPAEISQRAQDAVSAVNDSDPYFKQALAQYHGLGTGEIAAYFLDDKRALPLLEQQVQQSKIGAAAFRQGLTLSADQAMQYASQGVSQAQAESGFGQVAAVLPQEQLLGQISGTPYTQQDAQDEFISGLASAQRKRRLLNQQEQARFAGSGGADTRALRGSQPGSY